MRQSLYSVLMALCLGTSAGMVRAGEPLVTGIASGRILAAGTDKVIILSPSGETLWQYPAKLVHDVWMLPSGNVLFADGDAVKEVTPDKTVAFEYKSPAAQGGGTYSCQRLPDGNTLIGENSTGKILEVDRAGKVVFSLQIQPFKLGDHHNLRMVRKLESGNYLVCQSGARVVKEYTPQGQVVWESAQPGALAFAAIRTSKGTTVVSSLDQIIEYDASGKRVWECSINDLSGISVRNLTGIHLLPNGNIIAGCYAAYKEGAGCGLLEITREKKVVWRYSNPKADSSMMGVELLTPSGAPLPGPCLR